MVNLADSCLNGITSHDERLEILKRIESTPADEREEVVNLAKPYLKDSTPIHRIEFESSRP